MTIQIKIVNNSINVTLGWANCKIVFRSRRLPSVYIRDEREKKNGGKIFVYIVVRCRRYVYVVMMMMLLLRVCECFFLVFIFIFLQLNRVLFLNHFDRVVYTQRNVCRVCTRFCVVRIVGRQSICVQFLFRANVHISRCHKSFVHWLIL